LRGSSRGIAAALALGAGTTWNMSSVGAVGDPLARSYGVSLATVGLFTTTLVLTHFLVQLPAGRHADHFGAARVGLAAAGACVAGNALALVAPVPALALVARACVGIGSGAGFVAGADLMRASRPSPVFQGLFGASTMAGGGLAIAIVPQLEDALGWRAPYWSGLAIAVVVGTVTLLAPAAPRHARRAAAIVADRRLLPLGAVHAASFGLSFVAANWIVTLLERHGAARRDAAVVGALVLLGGILTRPLGGLVLLRGPRAARTTLALCLVTISVACLGLAAPLPLAALGAATAAVGVAAGLPFAILFATAQRLRPDAPAAALAFVNAWAILGILVGTPVAGVAFDLPGDGRLAFAAMAAVCAAALPMVGRIPFEAAAAASPSLGRG
jgi:MFS family permease